MTLEGRIGELHLLQKLEVEQSETRANRCRSAETDLDKIGVS